MIAIPDLDFARYELKFYISPGICQLVREMIKPYMEPDPFSRRNKENQYDIRSLYLDNDLWDSYYENLDGLEVRRKLRIRSYGPGEKDIFLEIKKKINNSVSKRRYPISRNSLPRVIEGGIKAEGKRGWFLNNFLYLRERLMLKPQILIEYRREAHIGTLLPKVRVTFDRNVRAAASPDLVLCPEFLRWMEAIGDDLIILEIKFNELIPRFLREIVRELNLSHEPISKYCAGVRACDLV